jgi:hypothetical protein
MNRTAWVNTEKYCGWFGERSSTPYLEFKTFKWPKEYKYYHHKDGSIDRTKLAKEVPVYQLIVHSKIWDTVKFTGGLEDLKEVFSTSLRLVEAEIKESSRQKEKTLEDS